MRRALAVLLVLLGLAGLAWVAFLIFVRLLFAGWFDDPADGFREASDAELIQVFHAQRTEIEALRAMHRQDRGIGPIGTDNIGRWWRHGGGWHLSGSQRRWPTRDDVLREVGLAPERDAEYRRLFAAVGVYRVYAGDPERDGYDTELCLTRRGNVVRAVLKSFVFAPGDAPPNALVPRPGDPDTERFTRLGDGWYLRYLDR